jgi:hypothetical protein
MSKLDGLTQRVTQRESPHVYFEASKALHMGAPVAPRHKTSALIERAQNRVQVAEDWMSQGRFEDAKNHLLNAQSKLARITEGTLEELGIVAELRRIVEGHLRSMAATAG